MTDEIPAPPRRGYARSGAELVVEDRNNATVTTAITLHNCGLVGSKDFKRTLEVGTRVQITDELQLGSLYRILFPNSSDHGSLVHAEDIEPDAGSGYGLHYGKPSPGPAEPEPSGWEKLLAAREQAIAEGRVDRDTR